MRVMITGVGGPAGSSLARQLAERGVEVYGVDLHAVRDPHLSDQARVPAASDPAMLGALARLAEVWDVDLLIPTVSDELPNVARAAAEGLLPRPVAISGPPAVARAHDKYLTMRRLEREGAPVPRFGLPTDFASHEDAVRALGSPLVLKPRVGRGGRGFSLLAEDAAVDWHSLGPDLIVQEYAPGTEYAPMVYAAPGKAPDDVVVVVKDHPSEGGSSPVSRVRTGAAQDVAAAALDAVRALGLTGPVDLDVRRDRRGRPVVLEANARFGANSAHAPELLAAVLADYAGVGAGAPEGVLR